MTEGATACQTCGGTGSESPAQGMGPYRLLQAADAVNGPALFQRPTRDKHLGYTFYTAACQPLRSFQITRDPAVLHPQHLYQAANAAVAAVACEVGIDERAVLATIPAADIETYAEATYPSHQAVIAYIQAEQQKQAGAQLLGAIVGLVGAHLLGMDGSAVVEPLSAVAGGVISSAVADEQGNAVLGPLMQALYAYDQILIRAAHAIENAPNLQAAWQRATLRRRRVGSAALGVSLGLVLFAPLQWFGGGVLFMVILGVVPVLTLIAQRAFAGLTKPRIGWPMLLTAWVTGWWVAGAYRDDLASSTSTAAVDPQTTAAVSTSTPVVASSTVAPLVSTSRATPNVRPRTGASAPSASTVNRETCMRTCVAACNDDSACEMDCATRKCPK